MANSMITGIITLRKARESRGFSIDALAISCGITVDEIEMYENDTRKMPFDIARKLKRLLQLRIEQIYVGLESDYIKNHLEKRA